MRYAREDSIAASRQLRQVASSRGKHPRVSRRFGRCAPRRAQTKLAGWESLETRQLLAIDLTALWLADDLVGQLPEGGKVTAWSDGLSGIPATASGTPQLLTDGAGGRALVHFDARDGADSLFIDANVSPLTGAADFSVVVAFQTDSDALQGSRDQWFKNTGIVDANQLGIGLDWGLSINAAGQLSTGLGAGLGAVPQTVYSSASGLNDGQLHIAVITRQAGTLSLNVDQFASDQLTGASAAPRSRLDLVLGALTDQVTGFTGELGQVRLYNGAFAASEVVSVQSEVRDYYSNSGEVSAGVGLTPSIRSDSSFAMSTMGPWISPCSTAKASTRSTTLTCEPLRIMPGVMTRSMTKLATVSCGTYFRATCNENKVNPTHEAATAICT